MNQIYSWVISVILIFKKIKISPFSRIYNFGRLQIETGVEVENFSVLRGGEFPPHLLKIGGETRVRARCYISARMGEVSIGRYCYFAHNCWIGGRGLITIGDNVIFGPNVVIVSSNHDLRSSARPRFSEPEISGTIEIGDNVWVGANSTILPGVRIGENAIIGAGSVVSKDVPAGSLAVGNPAKVQRSLDGDRLLNDQSSLD